MADQQPTIPKAPFPAPPPFWKYFTAENLSRLKAIKKGPKKAEDEDLPVELSYLQPPPPPQESYNIFGEEQTLSAHLPELSSLGITQLYPSTSAPQTQPLHHPNYLLQILRSLHLNFGELVTILSRNPALKDEKLEDIKNLFQNAHWLINIYRPHQARESLIATMENQIEEGRREMEECDKAKERVEAVFRGLKERGRNIIDGDGEATVATPPKKSDGNKGEANHLWKMMMAIDVDAD